MMVLANKMNTLLVVTSIICLIFVMVAGQKAVAGEVETIGGFLMKIVRTMDLEKELPSESSVGFYLCLLLEKDIIKFSSLPTILGLVSPLTPNLAASDPLTKGVMAVILVYMWNLQGELPAEPAASNYIDILVRYQVMTPGSPEALVGTDEVAKFLENPIAAAALAQPYLKPVLP